MQNSTINAAPTTKKCPYCGADEKMRKNVLIAVSG